MKAQITKIFSILSSIPRGIWQVVTLAFFLIFILVVRMICWLLVSLHFFKKTVLEIEKKIISKAKNFSRKINAGRKDGIDQVDLIEFSLKNMRMRKTRTFVTIGGMTIGIAIIVFLVSVGYGLQDLVVSRVAKLDQMKQAEVSLHAGSKMKINDQTMTTLSEITGVKNVLPLISVVGKVGYNSSVSDMVVYGVTSDYLKNSDIRVSQGEFFENNELTNAMMPEVVQPEESEGFDQDISFSIKPDQWVKVRENSDRNSKIIGYTKAIDELKPGKEVIGGEYIDEDGSVQRDWIVSEFLLWEKLDCSKEDCSKSEYSPRKGGGNSQLSANGSIAIIGVNIKEDHDNDGDANLNIEQVNGSNETIAVSAKEAVVNQSMLQVLGISGDSAIGKEFDVSFVVVGNLLGDGVEKKESQKMQYKIVGVVAEGKMPIFYVPFVDLRGLGVVNYSQLKVVGESQEVLPLIRKQIETSGYATTSVSDTVDQINSFFATARMILGLVGMVALFIASLGMFNTLTVSLLERTREVGLLKAMGMRSGEVRNLFLTESIIMSFLGGVLGVALGVALGKAFSGIISIYSVSVGFDVLNLTSVPWKLAFGIVTISLAVGFMTGFYPARRAQKISALNALRYE
ncbi:MAG: macrolide export ATP-binding/permease protein [uncultured bacterium]|nr:MAG: macrolide export ATP-binding/permease protein [uncultured bacterium]